MLADSEFEWGDDILSQLSKGTLRHREITRMVHEQMATETGNQKHRGVLHTLSLSWSKQFPKASIEEYRLAQPQLASLAWKIVLEDRMKAQFPPKTPAVRFFRHLCNGVMSFKTLGLLAVLKALRDPCPSHSKIAAAALTTEKTVRTHLKRLEESALIIRKRRRDRNGYRLPDRIVICDEEKAKMLWKASVPEGRSYRKARSKPNGKNSRAHFKSNTLTEDPTALHEDPPSNIREFPIPKAAQG